MAGNINMPGGSKEVPRELPVAAADISSGDCRVCIIGREKEGVITACCWSWWSWGEAGAGGSGKL